MDKSKVYLLENILTDRERKKIVKDVQPLLLSGKELQQRFPDMEYKPGKHTLAELYSHPDFREVQQRIIDQINAYFYSLSLFAGEDRVKVDIHKSWIFSTRGQREFWHTHPKADWAAVYYIKTVPFFDNGTLFRSGLFKAPQNSLILFPGWLRHSAPTFPFRFNRYTWGMDLTVVA